MAGESDVLYSQATRLTGTRRDRQAHETGIMVMGRKLALKRNITLVAVLFLLYESGLLTNPVWIWASQLH